MKMIFNYLKKEMASFISSDVFPFLFLCYFFLASFVSFAIVYSFELDRVYFILIYPILFIPVLILLFLCVFLFNEIFYIFISLAREWARKYGE